jgi:inosine-uridine nucleoside N-ribohydrolase
MKKQIRSLAFLGICLVSISIFSQVNIIFDTDFGGDADDLGALAMLNNFIEHGECNLLAVMSWSTEQYAVSAIDAVNRYYGHPDIPIGTRKDSVHFMDWSYSKPIADQFDHVLNQEKAQDATLLYRKILAASPDTSVTLVTVGPLKNIENLIRSEADSLSELSGEELITRKVREIVMMGGQFPQGEKEWNFNGDMPGVTKYVLQHITVPITYSGYEVGAAIKTGEEFNRTDPNTPLYVGFMYFSEHASWVNSAFKGKILDNSTFDQTAVLYAVRGGVGSYWAKITGGKCVADDFGGNTWIEDSSSGQSYLKLIMDGEELAVLIESFMLNRF